MIQHQQKDYWKQYNRTEKRKNLQHIYHSNYYKKLKILWYGNELRDKPWFMNKAQIRASENFVVTKILPELSYCDIVNVVEQFYQFPFDVLARKDGKIYGFSVTTAPYKKLDGAVNFLSNYLGITAMLCFIKPDLSFYWLTEINQRHEIRIPLSILSKDGESMTLSQVQQPKT